MRTRPLLLLSLPHYSMLLLLLGISFFVPETVAQSYLDNVYKYTGCTTDCSNINCMSGYRIYSDWAHWTVSDSFGTSYSFCGWAWENRCKCNGKRNSAKKSSAPFVNSHPHPRPHHLLTACNRGHFDSLTDCTKVRYACVQVAHSFSNVFTHCSPPPSVQQDLINPIMAR